MTKNQRIYRNTKYVQDEVFKAIRLLWDSIMTFAALAMMGFIWSTFRSYGFSEESVLKVVGGLFILCLGMILFAETADWWTKQRNRCGDFCPFIQRSAYDWSNEPQAVDLLHDYAERIFGELALLIDLGILCGIIYFVCFLHWNMTMIIYLSVTIFILSLIMRLALMTLLFINYDAASDRIKWLK